MLGIRAKLKSFVNLFNQLYLAQQGEQAAAAGTAVAPTAQSCISQSFGQAKNYGTLSGSEDAQLPETLTYAWHNVDIFGAVHQPGSGWRQLVNRTRGLFCNERHIPAPRKHLLKNGIRYPNGNCL